jgi:pimeloyl-ACP methyl ester carboxylesterase
VLGTNTNATITIKPYIETQGIDADYEFLNRIIFKDEINKYITLDIDPSNRGNEGIKAPSGQIYRQYQYIDDPVSGFQAVGFISESGAPPVLVFNGTNPDERLGKDILDDLNAAGVGKNQFSNNIANIRTFIDDANRFLNINGINQLVDITGYSLGGANAQQAAAYFTGKEGYKLGSLVTLNSPGISLDALADFKGSNIQKVTHYIVNGDLVSLAGQVFLPGDYKLVEWNTPGASSLLPFGDKHNTADSKKFYLSDLPDIQRRDGVTITSNFIDKNYLSNPSFSYWSKPTEDWLSTNIALAILSRGQIPILLSTRTTVEGSRELLGSLLSSAITLLTTDNQVNFAATFAKRVLENPQFISELVDSSDLHGVETWNSFNWGVFTAKTLFTGLNVGLPDVTKLLVNEFSIGLVDVAKVLTNQLGASLEETFNAIVYGAGNGSIASLLNGINALTGSGLLSDGSDDNSFFDTFELANFLINRANIGLTNTAQVISQWTSASDKLVSVFQAIVYGAGNGISDLTAIRAIGFSGLNLIATTFPAYAGFLWNQVGSIRTIKALQEGGRNLPSIFSDLRSGAGVSPASAIEYLVGAKVLGGDFNSVKNLLLSQFNESQTLSILKELGFSTSTGAGNIIGKVIDSLPKLPKF